MLPLNYKVDFVCFKEVLIEVKAVDSIHDRHVSQLINYLKASQMKRGLLLNFGATSLQHKRICELMRPRWRPKAAWTRDLASA